MKQLLHYFVFVRIRGTKLCDGMMMNLSAPLARCRCAVGWIVRAWKGWGEFFLAVSLLAMLECN